MTSIFRKIKHTYSRYVPLKINPRISMNFLIHTVFVKEASWASEAVRKSHYRLADM